MISPFGVDHGYVVSKAAKPPREKYVPTPEQLEIQRARRAAQQAEKMNRRSGVGSKLSFGAHVKAMGKVPSKTAGAALVTGGALYALNHKEKVSKAEKKNVALGATAGAAGTYAVSNVVGQSLKIGLKERRVARGTSPREEKIWAEHKAKHPKGGHKVFAHYPKELQDWRGQRALARMNNPKVAAATMIAGTAAGAAYGAKKSEISKIALRRVWHTTLPVSAKKIYRQGPKESPDGLLGRGVYATDKREGLRPYRQFSRKNKNAADVPMYVSGPGRVRGKNENAGFSAYDRKQIVDVGRPRYIKHKPPPPTPGAPQV